MATATTAAASGTASVIRIRGGLAVTVIGPSLRSILVALALVAAGCASSTELPPAAGPDDSPPLERRPAGELVDTAPAPARRTEALVDGGRKLAVLSPRRRVLEVHDATTGELLDVAPAGAGPTHVVAGERGLAYVVDTAGDGLLVFETHGRLRILRRYPLLGAPYAAASDLRNGRLWVTLTARNELVELATSARPHRLNLYPTVRRPNAVAVDPAGRVYVHGEQLQRLDPRRTR